MKASKFTDAQKAFIIKQGKEGTSSPAICLCWMPGSATKARMSYQPWIGCAVRPASRRSSVPTTSYVRNDWRIWHQVIAMLERSGMFECGSVRHFGQQHVSPIINTEYAFAV